MTGDAVPSVRQVLFVGHTGREEARAAVRGAAQRLTAAGVAGH